MLKRWGGLAFYIVCGMIWAHQAEPTIIEGYSGPSNPPVLIAPQIAPPQQVEISIGQDVLSNPRIVGDWQSYTSRLGSCIPGTYVLWQINPLTAAQYGNIETDKILGKEEDLCHVIMMYYRENDPRLFVETFPNLKTPSGKKISYPTGQECRFKQSTVDSIVEFETNLLSGQTFTVSNRDPLSVAVAEECIPYVVIDGQKTIANDSNI